MARRLALVALVSASLALAAARRARGDDGPAEGAGPAARVDVAGWTARGGSGVRTDVGLSLDDDVRLELFLDQPRPWAWERSDARAAAAWLRVGDLRLVAGQVGEDRAFHLGYAPGLRVEPSSWLAIETDLDLAVGAAAWSPHDRPVAERTGTWRELPDELSLVAGTAAAALRAEVRPLHALRLEADLEAGATLAAAPPRGDQGTATLLVPRRLARAVDVGPSVAASRAWAGASAAATVRVLEWKTERGARGDVEVGYLEAWDWIHLDPLPLALEVLEPDSGTRLARLPVRVTRSVEGRLSWSPASGVEAGLRLDVTRVTGSTLAGALAERDGWSLGLGVDLRLGALALEVGARVRLGREDRDLVAAFGEPARVEASARASLDLLRTDATRVSVVASIEAGLADAWGVPRRTALGLVGLSVELGGESARTRFARLASPPPPGPHGPCRLLASAVGGGDGVGGGGTPPPTLDDPRVGAVRDRIDRGEALGPADLESALEVLEADPAFARALLDPARVERFLDRRPDVAAHLDRMLPGTTRRLRTVFGLDGAPADGAPAEGRPGLVVASFGRCGLRLGSLPPRGVGDLAETADEVLLLRGRGDEVEVVLQAESRRMRWLTELLSGRTFPRRR